MLKKTLCAVLALLLLCSFPLAASAEETIMGSATTAKLAAALTSIGTGTREMYETESNNSVSEANDIDYDLTYVYGWIGTGDDCDYYRLTMTESCYMKFAAVSDNETIDGTGFTLCGSSGEELITAVYMEADGVYAIDYPLAPGIYYIRVTESQSEDTTAYAFLFRFQPQVDAPAVSTGNEDATGVPVLQWSADEKASSYSIYRATSESGPYTCLGSTQEPSFTDTTAELGNTYYYKVKAASASEAYLDSEYSSVVSAVCKCAQPAVTVGYNAATGKPVVRWESVDGGAKYYIYRATSESGPYTKVKTAVTARRYEDTNAEAGINYYYKVKAIHENTDASSAYSAAVSRVCDLKRPEVSISSNASTGKPVVQWETVDGAAKYYIYRAASESGSYTKVKTAVTARSYEDTNAKAGTTYYYKVKAIHENTSANSAYSTSVSGICDLPSPNVTLKVDTASGKPKVTFEKVSGAEKYYIVRSTSKSGTYSKLATITGTTYIDSTAKVGTNYYYKVKALHAKDAADSAYSEVVNRVCDLKKPVVTITCNSSGNPWLKWSAISGAEKYEIYRAASKTGTYELVKTTVTATSFADRDVTAGKTYYYKVRAIHENTAANSAYSAIKYIKAK